MSISLKGRFPKMTPERLIVVLLLAYFVPLAVFLYLTAVAPLPGWTIGRSPMFGWILRYWVLGLFPAIVVLTFIAHLRGWTK